MRYLDYVQPKTRWSRWAWSPIIVLRVSLVATYLLWVYAAGIAFISGVPIFEETTVAPWRLVWSFLLGTSAIIAAIGSLDDRWQRVERWASMVLSAMALTYAVALNLVAYGDADFQRQFGGAVAIIALILPLTRFIYLAAQSGKIKRHDIK